MNIYQSIPVNRKTQWGVLAAAFAAALLIAMLAAGMVSAAGTTYVVDDDGMATNNNCNSSTATPYTTVTAGIAAAAAGDTVKVCPGAYAENVVIDKAITLKGAKAGTSFTSRTFGSASESTVTGQVTVQAADVKVDGFSFTNPNQGLGVVVKTVANNTVFKNNFVKTVGSNAFVGPVVGVYLELGPDNVQVTRNWIGDIQSSTGSAQGVLIGDSTSGDPSLQTQIIENTFSDITSVTRGAYGILANNGASSAGTATGYTELEATGNTIQDLTGEWAHGIGLEGEAPNAVVTYNTIQNLTDVTPTPANDAVAVFFEDNPFFFTAEVNYNNVAIGPTSYGIAVHPTLATLYPSLSVDGECNWWGSKSGAGAVGTGTGSLVSTNVDFKPALKSVRLDSNCGDKDHHDNDHHHGDWGPWDHKKWGDD